MIKFKRIFCFLLFLIPFQAQALYWSPHAGFDFKYWGVRAKNKERETYEEVFPKMTNAFSFYVGSRVNGFFGFDLGYDQSTTKEKSMVYTGNEFFLVQNVPAPPEPAGNSSIIDVRLKAWFAHFNFYYEMMRNLELIGLLGISTLKPDTHISYVNAGTRVEISQKTNSKASARIGVGIQYNPWWFLGLRAMAIWDQTSRLNYEGFDVNQNFFSIRPYKNASSYHLGFVCSFSKPRR